MKLFKIYTKDDNVLHEKAKAVSFPLSEETKKTVLDMVQYLKEENPEINSAILEVAKFDENIDLKAVALGAYLSYRLLEIATENDNLGLVEE